MTQKRAGSGERRAGSSEQRAGSGERRPETASDVDLPWWPADRGRVERTPLTRDQIVQAAIRLLDTEDLEALSMRRLGQELGSGATSLYWHVKSKDELLDLVMDEILGEVGGELAIDDHAPWQEQVAEAARAFRRTILRHRGAAILLGTRVTIGPKTLAVSERAVGIFRMAGFDGQGLVLAFQTVINFATGSAVFETRGPSGPMVEDLSNDELADLMGELLAGLPPAQFPNLVALAGGVPGITDEMQFEYGLARIIDGLEAELRRERRKRRDGGR